MSPESTILEGDLDRVVFESPEGGFVVAVLRPHGTLGEIRIVGELTGIRVGEHLRCEGRWVDDPRYGRQFRVSSFTPILPTSTRGIERYLATAGIKGIGEGMAKRIVEKFAGDTFEVIEREAHRLAEVPGLGPSRAQALSTAFAAQRASRDAMVFLQSHGVGPALARKIHHQYGDRAVTIVKENPYRLAQELSGIGFRTADAIARSLGYDLGSPERAAGAAIHVLEAAADEGHLYLPAVELKKRCDTLEVPANTVAEAVDALRDRGDLVLEGAGAHACVYLARFHRLETQAAAHLDRLLATPGPALYADAVHAVDAFERESGVKLAAGQRQAVARALQSKVFVLTGGPGTGKTTLVNAIISLLRARGLEVDLAAPTGRAAKRLEEASGRSASTLHRLLEFNPRTGRFQRNADDPLTTGALIVDEASMVDLSLFVAVLRALRASARLYLVGDVDQLPSVAAGDVLRDVIASGIVPMSRLTEIFRQAGGSAIVENAHRVNRGEVPVVAEADSDFFHVERPDAQSSAQTILEIVQERIPRRFGLDPVWDVQVLAPMYRGLAGVDNLNRVLQAALNGPRPLAAGDRERLVLVPPAAERESGLPYRVGDKVIQMRNNYDKEVFNGDVGRVVSFDAQGREAVVEYEGRKVTYSGDGLEELQLAYALSVHKSQGSEYPAVVLCLLKEHFKMLQRNLLYTALTRGKRLVVIVGQRRALELAVENASQRERYSRLADRLRELASRG